MVLIIVFVIAAIMTVLGVNQLNRPIKKGKVVFDQKRDRKGRYAKMAKKAKPAAVFYKSSVRKIPIHQHGKIVAYVSVPSRSFVTVGSVTGGDIQ